MYEKNSIIQRKLRIINLLLAEVVVRTRKRRIAAGSGTKVEEINRLLKQFEQMQKMMKQFGSKNGKLGRRARKQLAGMNLEQLQNSIPGNIPGVPPGLMPKK